MAEDQNKESQAREAQAEEAPKQDAQAEEAPQLDAQAEEAPQQEAQAEEAPKQEAKAKHHREGKKAIANEPPNAATRFRFHFPNRIECVLHLPENTRCAEQQCGNPENHGHGARSHGHEIEVGFGRILIVNGDRLSLREVAALHHLKRIGPRRHGKIVVAGSVRHIAQKGVLQTGHIDPGQAHHT